jgi:hypothetical protein
MPRLRRRGRNVRRGIDAATWCAITEQPEPAGVAPLIRFHLRGLHRDLPLMLELWADFGSDIMELWQRSRPGERPEIWWRAQAPRMSDAERARLRFTSPAWDWLPELRRRIGGLGAPAFEPLNMTPELHHGVPTRFITHDDVATFSTPERFRAEPVDPADPPRYEDEAVYLARHELLTASERRALRLGRS